MNDENKKIALTNLEFILVIIVAALLGLGISYIIRPVTLKNSNYKKVDSNIQTIIDTYNRILENYYTDLDESTIVDGAIKGMLDATGDPYTVYMDDSTYSNFNIQLNGAYNGIGVQIAKLGNDIVIAGIIDDSPAKEAGLKVGDIIISIDDLKASEMSTYDFSTYVRNSDKSEYIINIKRNDEEKKIKVDKKHVVLKSVASEIKEISSKKIGYIYISIFANNTYEQFKEQLNNLESKGIDSLIIDLRDNTGGELDATTNIISLFLKHDKIIYQTEDRDGNIKKTYSRGNKDKKYPIVVIVNKNTASASEVLTAALKDNLSAVVVGENTYGKGTVQTVLTASNGEQYKMTTRKWLTPAGDWINEKGITPTISVELDAKKDTQLESAIDYIVKH